MVVMLRIAFLLMILKVYHGGVVTPTMTIKRMIRGYGYPVEEHEDVKTEDGYLLTLHRIPYGITNKKLGNRSVVFLMHGIFSSSFDWINMGPGVSIAYDLVESGYDVWMGNARGNKFSRKHERLHPILNRKKFWNFSWHEIGYYDLPAMIDFVLKITHQKKLSYIGHSQGTTTFFVMGSMRPKYNDKVKLMIALAPVAFMDNMRNPLMQLIAKMHDPVNLFLNMLGWHEFLPGEDLLNLIGRKLCSSHAEISAMCASIFFMVCGWDSHQLNKSSIPMILSNVPAGASTKQFVHYAQVMTSGEFQRYDFGSMENLAKYDSIYPPLYRLARISAPISLFYAPNDWLSSRRDFNRLKKKLKNVVDVYRVPFKHFNHLDYLFAIDLKTLVNDHCLELLRTFD